MGSFAEFLGQPATQTPTNKTGNSFASFLASQTPIAPPVTAKVNPPSTSPFNPNTPGHNEFITQLDQKAPPTSITGNIIPALLDPNTYLSSQNQQRSSVENTILPPKSAGMTFKVGDNLSVSQQQTAKTQIIKETLAGQSEQAFKQQSGVDNMDLNKTVTDFLQFTPRAVASLAASLLPTKYQNEYEPSADGKLIKYILGDQTIKPLAQQTVESENALKDNGFGKLSTPLALAGVVGNETLGLYPLISPLANSANNLVAKLADMATKESGIEITFADAKKIVNGDPTVDPAKLEAFKKTALGNQSLLKTFKDGALQITKTEDTPLSSFLKKASGGTPGETTFNVSGETQSVKPTLQLSGSTEPFSHEINSPTKPFAHEIVTETPKTAPGTAITPKVQNIVYRGEAKGGIDTGKGYKFYTDNQTEAKKYADISKPLNGEAQVVSQDITGKNFKEVQKSEYLTAIEDPKIKAQYDGIKFNDNGNTSYAIFDKPSEKPTVTSTEGNKTSGIATSINAKAIEQGMTDKGFEDLAEFNGTSFKEQADLVSKLDPEQAKAIVRGEQPLPSNVRSAALISAMEDLAKKTGDVSLMQDLANSPLATKISESASEVSLARMREKDSATMKLQEIKKAREARIEKTVSAEKRKVAKTAKAETEKVNLSPDEQSWDNFLNEITC